MEYFKLVTNLLKMFSFGLLTYNHKIKLKSDSNICIEGKSGEIRPPSVTISSTDLIVYKSSPSFFLEGSVYSCNSPPFDVYYKISKPTDESEYKLLKHFERRTDNIYQFKKSILLQDFELGEYTITVKAEIVMSIYDSTSLTYAEDVSFITFTLDNQEFTYNDGKSFLIVGRLSDRDGYGTYTIYYQIDEYNPVQMNPYILSSAYPITISEAINFTSELPESDSHSIKIWASDESNQNTSIKTLNFSFKYNYPVITYSTIPNLIYTHNVDTQILIVGQISDKDGNEVIDTFYQFDSLTKNKLESIELSNPSTKHRFEYFIGIPTRLTEGVHTLYLWCSDKKSKETEHKAFRFIFNYNNPVLTINTPSNLQFRKNDGEKLSIVGSFSDADAQGTITIKYYFDSQKQEEQTLLEQTINQNLESPFEKSIEIPSTLSEGPHSVVIYAIDTRSKRSENNVIPFSYTYNPPVLSINSDSKTISRDFFSTPQIHVSGSISNPDLMGIVEVYYQLDEDALKVLRSYNIVDLDGENIRKTIDLSGNLPEGMHTMIFYGIDSSGKRSNTCNLIFTFVLISPKLSITTQNDLVLRKNVDTYIPISGRVDDYSGKVTIKYILESQEQNLTTKSVNLFKPSFSENIAIPDNLTEGKHFIVFYAVSQEGKISNFQTYGFTFSNNAPVFEITSSNEWQLNRNENIIPIIGTIQDQDGSGSVSIKYNIDSRGENTLSTYEISNIYSYDVNEIIPIPDGLLGNNHNIILYAIDESGKKSNNIRIDFNYISTSPVIKITTVDGQQFKKNDGKQLIISGTIKDPDATGQVTVFYRLDSHSDFPIKTYDIESRGEYEINYTVPFPNDLTEGNHQITVYAIDSDVKISNEHIIKFSYQFSGPSISITENPKNAYHNKIDQSIHVEGFINSDNGATSFTFKYCFDNSNNAGTDVDRKSFNPNDNGFSLDIEIDSMVEGNHTIFIWVVDNFNKESPKYDKKFEFLFNKPSISISTPYDEYYRTTNKSIHMKGRVSDSDCSGIMYLMFKFNDLEQNNMTIVEISNCDSTEFEKDVVIPTNLDERLHILYVWCVDETNKQSDICEYRFYYKYNSPELIITVFDQKPYKRNIDKTIHIEGTVSDKDGLGSVTIGCNIDNIESDTKTIVIENTNPYPFTFDLAIPSHFSEGYHKIIIFARDESNKPSFNVSKNIEYIYNHPSITLDSKDNQVVYGNVDNKYPIKGSVRHDDGTGTVKIKYNIDQDGENYLTDVSIRNAEENTFDEYIELDKDLREGRHSIVIYGTDGNNKDSNYNTLHFTFLINNKAKRMSCIHMQYSTFSLLRTLITNGFLLNRRV